MKEEKTVKKVFQIFRAGKHTSMSGTELEFSESDLQSTALTYPPNSAPLVLGHPPDDKPVYGRVVSLFVKGSKLFAQADVGETLLRLVKEGRYINRSAGFYGALSPANPRRGVWTLKQVGFLGAHPPAVKGMDPLDFAGSEGCMCFASDCGTDVCTNNDDIFQFAAPDGYQAEPAALSLYQLAKEYRRACPELSFAEAAGLAAPYLNHKQG